MTAQIIQFPVKRAEPWPGGELGAAMQGLAESLCRRGREKGKPITIERARRVVQDAMREQYPTDRA